jgi:hypothetical protein
MATGTVRLISGDDWEREIIALLGRRYAPGDFIEVPADDCGDLGMDGIGRDGVVYQCYAAQEPCTNDDRKAKQKAKIYEDLNKLIKNQVEHKAILGGIAVKRWMLVVPLLTSKDLQAYANKRAETVRNSGCDYIASDFEATVSTDRFLSAERTQLVRGVLRGLHLQVDGPSQEEVDSWRRKTESVSLLAKLQEKLEMLDGDFPVHELEMKYLNRYLLSNSLLENLESSHPQIYEVIVRTKNAFERLLEARCEVSMAAPNDTLLAELEFYGNELQNTLANDLDAEHVAQIAQGDVTDWLMRCPLRFNRRQTT